MVANLNIVDNRVIAVGADEVEIYKERPQHKLYVTDLWAEKDYSAW